MLLNCKYNDEYLILLKGPICEDPISFGGVSRPSYEPNVDIRNKDVDTLLGEI